MTAGVKRAGGIAAIAILLAVSGCSSGPASDRSTPTSTASTPTSTASGANAPRWAHVVIVVEENRNSTSVIKSADAPYLNELAAQGLSFTDFHGETHPSQPNYLALFSGSTQSVTDDTCPHDTGADNLGHELLTRGYTFAGYSESLPAVGYAGCDAYPYARRHNPWVDFTDLPIRVNQPLSALPADFSSLPDLSFVIPNVQNDMHDGTVAAGDAWLRTHLSEYVIWARNHRSLLVVTWDEDEGSAGNHIATIAVGQGISPSTWTSRVDHYALLRAIEDSFRLPALGAAATAPTIAPIAGD